MPKNPNQFKNTPKESHYHNNLEKLDEIDTEFQNVDNKINTAKQDAISESNEYCDNQINGAKSQLNASIGSSENKLGKRIDDLNTNLTSLQQRHTTDKEQLSSDISDTGSRITNLQNQLTSGYLTVKNATNSTNSTNSTNAQYAQYASEDTSKGTIDSRINALENEFTEENVSCLTSMLNPDECRVYDFTTDTVSDPEYLCANGYYFMQLLTVLGNGVVSDTYSFGIIKLVNAQSLNYSCLAMGDAVNEYMFYLTILYGKESVLRDVTITLNKVQYVVQEGSIQLKHTKVKNGDNYFTYKLLCKRLW